MQGSSHRLFTASVAVTLLTACVASTEAPGPSSLPGVRVWAQAIHTDLLSRYTPRTEWQAEDPMVNHSGLVPFSGDCEDYFTAAWNRLSANGLRPRALVMRQRRDASRGHIVACTTTDTGRWVCLDPDRRRVVSRNFYRYRYTDLRELGQPPEPH